MTATPVCSTISYRFMLERVRGGGKRGGEGGGGGRGGSIDPSCWGCCSDLDTLLSKIYGIS